MPRIFVSYRRSDSAGHAGRLFDRLRDHFGADCVFRDVDQLKPGDDFVDALARAVDSCDVFVLVIGRDWVDARNAKGDRRLDDPKDFVRLELESALRRKILIVPVLVEGATMFDEEQVPEPLRPVARRQAIELSEHRWDFDVQELLRTIENVGGRRPRKRLAYSAALLGVALLIIAGLAARFDWLGSWRGKPPDEPAAERSVVPQPLAPQTPTQAPASPPPVGEQSPPQAERQGPPQASAAPQPRGDLAPEPAPSIKPATDAGPKAERPAALEPRPEPDAPAGPANATANPEPLPPSTPSSTPPLPATVEVPGVVGQDMRTAATALRAAGFLMKSESSSGVTGQPGTVYAQRPPSGTMAKRGETIRLYVVQPLQPNEHAAGQALLSLSEVLDLDRDREGREGWDVSFARATDTGVTLSFGRARAAPPRVPRAPRDFDPSACEGAAPSLSTVAIESLRSYAVVCVKTTGGRMAAIQIAPTNDQSEISVRYSTLTTNPRTATTDSGRPGSSAEPPAGAAGRVRMPQLVGRPIADAREALGNLGLRIRAEYNSVGKQKPDTVFSQSPDAGSIVDRGTVVQVYVEMSLGRNEHAAGRLLLSVNEFVQLDRDEDGSRRAVDIGFRTAGAGFSIEFSGGAEGALLRRQAGETRSLDPSVCRAVRLSSASIPFAGTSGTQPLCVRTTAGRFALVHLGAVRGDSPELAIRYSTLDR
jgi:hypothetical protein